MMVWFSYTYDLTSKNVNCEGKLMWPNVTCISTNKTHFSPFNWTGCIFKQPHVSLSAHMTKSGYTWEKICNLNDHCNDNCNSSLEWSDLTHKRNFVTWMMTAICL